MQWSRKLLLVFLTPIAAGASDLSSGEGPLSLDAAVAQALSTAPQVDAQAANLDAAMALGVSAGRLPDPELVIGLDNLPVTGSDAYSTTRDFMTMRKVGVMQEFPRAEKRRLQNERAEAQTSLATAELVQTRLTIAREVAQAWIRRATADASLEHLRALEPEFEQQAAAASAGLAAGRNSTAEALVAEAAVVQLSNRVLAMLGETRRATLDLARWIDADANRPLAPMPSLDQLPVSESALLASVQEHAALLSFESRTETARIDIALARAERRPDWSAALAFAKRGAEFSDMVSLEFRIGLPLSTKHRQDPVIAARSAELRRLEADRETELRMHVTELRQMLVEWELLGKRIDHYEKELLPLARERSRASLASYRSGRGDLRSALDAFAQEADFVIEHAELQNARGRAWAYLRYLDPGHLSPAKRDPT